MIPTHTAPLNIFNVCMSVTFDQSMHDIDLDYSYLFKMITLS